MKSNLVKILATLGLIVAIALILIGVFDVGKIGFKNFSSKLPILKCEINNPDGSKKMMFYDLEKIKNEDPTEGMSTEEYQKWRSQKNLDAVTFGDLDYSKEYSVTFVNHDNGIDKGYNVRIKKNTGEIEFTFPPHRPVSSSLDDALDAFANAQKFNGECVKIKRKNL